MLYGHLEAFHYVTGALDHTGMTAQCVFKPSHVQVYLGEFMDVLKIEGKIDLKTAHGVEGLNF